MDILFSRKEGDVIIIPISPLKLALETETLRRATSREVARLVSNDFTLRGLSAQSSAGFGTPTSWERSVAEWLLYRSLA